MLHNWNGLRAATIGALGCIALCMSPTAMAEEAAAKGPFSICEVYCPGHFGNSYEVMGSNEMRDVLAEAVFWGFNRYGDWYDTDDCKDPFAAQHTYGLGPALWESKKLHFAAAKSSKLECDLIITPNHVFLDQCLPDRAATMGPRLIGQLICPSNAEARKVILENYDRLFQDLAKTGVRLSRLSACPYDFGGCLCETCKPWILTFAKLTREIHQIAEKHHPGIRMDMIGWWWTADEHKQFADWVDREAPGWVQVMFLHIPYGQTRAADAVLPKGCQRGAFVHISYAEQTQPRDMYGHLGPLVAAERLERTIRELEAQGVRAVMAYSEGIYEDVNKAILAGMGTGAFTSADDVLRAYSRRYFDVPDDVANEWACWIRAWGKPFDVDLTKSREKLSWLIERTPSDTWRRKQWELKQQLFESHAKIGVGDRWSPERLAAVNQFWSVQEALYRGVWGLAPPRHIFARRFTPLPWYASWAKHQEASAQSIGHEQ